MQIANNLVKIKIQQNDFKKDLLSFKSNTQAAIKALEASQQAIGESQDFVNKEFKIMQSETRYNRGKSKICRNQNY